MGPGRSLEAPYELKASVPAGAYHVIYDSIIIQPVSVTFELIHRRDSVDTVLATWSQDFEPQPGGGFDAQPFEIDQDAPAIDFSSGDQLVFRYSGTNDTGSPMSWIPVGAPELEGGRHLSITLPR